MTTEKTVSSNVFDEFKWRGLVYDFTEGLPETLATEKVTVYLDVYMDFGKAQQDIQ